MLWGNMAERAILDALRNASVDALFTYRSEQDRRMDMYFGDQVGHTRASMAVAFKETYKSILPEAFFKFTRKIVDDQAMVYWQRPERTVTGGSERDEDEWERLVKVGKLDTTCRQVNRRTRLLWSMFLWVQHDATRDALTWVPVLPQCVYVQEDPDHPGDIRRAQLVIIPLDGRTASTEPGKADRQAWVAFNRTEICKFYGNVTDENVQVEEVFDGFPVDNPVTINGEPVNPFVASYDESSLGTMFLGFDGARTAPSSVVEGNISANLALTDMRNLVRLQANGQLVWNSTSKPPAKVVGGPGNVLHNKDVAGSVGYIQPGAQLDAVREELEQLLKWYSLLENLSPGALSTDPRELSGFALFLENINLVRFNTEQQEHYAESFEGDLFEMSTAVSDAHRKFKFSQGVEQNVKFKSLEFPADPNTAWATDKGKIDAGVKSEIDAIKAENPDLDDEAAEEKLKKNLEIHKSAAAPAAPPKRFFGAKPKPPEADEAET